MPLLLLDLDNTLVDRASAYRRWAEEFAARHGTGAGSEVDWLIAADADGYEPRERLKASIRDRYRLGTKALSELEDALRWGMADRLEPDLRVSKALAFAREDGWLPFVVTNGSVEQQERKLHITGLETEVAGWVISEAVGAKKPDPRIFSAAAEAAGMSLEGAWMIGDSPSADIQGARSLGLDSVWLHRGRAWGLEAFSPTLTAASLPEAIQAMRSQTGRPLMAAPPTGDPSRPAEQEYSLEAHRRHLRTGDLGPAGVRTVGRGVRAGLGTIRRRPAGA